jgi:small subunit ribosomal protein S17
MKIFTGKVIATKNIKTATVAVERVVTHPLYGKKMKREKNYQVHDEIGVKVNDIVKFVVTKPYSKTKKWRIVK